MSSANQISFIPVSQISLNPYQPRKFCSKKSLADLTDSIKKYGLINPITVRKINIDFYEIISGERRFRACKLLNFEKIPVIILELNQKDCLCLSLIENIQRSNLNYFEEAEGLKNIILEYNMSIEDLANIICQSEDYILRKLYLLNLSHEIQSTLLNNNLSEDYAFALLKLDDNNLQNEVLEKIIYYGLSLKTTKKLIDQILLSQDQSKYIFKIFKNKSVIKDLRIFFNTIKQAVNITKASGFNTEYIIDEQNGDIKINIKIAK